MPATSRTTKGMPQEETLDPTDWDRFRTQSHEILDELLDHIRDVRKRPAWRPVPDVAKRRIEEPLPVQPQQLEEIWRQVSDLLLPYSTGNLHPRFWGWVHGSGTPVGVLGEMIAAAINSNVGGREHAPVYIERQVVEWCKQLFGFPDAATGLVLSGTSMATVTGLAVARNATSGTDVRGRGVAALGAPLITYTSAEAHGSVRRALEFLGLGAESLRTVPTRPDFTMDVTALEERIAQDRAAGCQPFCIVGTAGTVSTGAVDDLDALADLCAAEGLWLHVDGAFGALLALSDALRPRLAGIERADSLAFDFHKWMHVPYSAGCLLVRRGDLHRQAFASDQVYLSRETRGTAAGDPWFTDFGPELSRGFDALKVWLTLKAFGTERLGAMIEKNCRQAKELAAEIERTSELELLAPVGLNVVCFRYAEPHLPEARLERVNREIVFRLQETGVAVPSTTRIGDDLAIRVAITNHRTRGDDLRLLVRSVRSIGRTVAAELGA